MSYPKCATCKHWRPKGRHRWLSTGETLEKSGFGQCKSPKKIYGYGTDLDNDGKVFYQYQKEDGSNHIKDMPTDYVNIENDEGWGAIFGEDFGCTHHSDLEVQNEKV